MADERNQRLERYIRYAAIILAGFLIALIIFLVVDYHALRQQKIIDMREMRISELLQKHAPLPVSDATVIRTWMTFDYINKLFALSPDYLQSKLSITDTHYPRLTIAGYAKKIGSDQAAFLGEVENAVREHS